jgi:hypothetical protein
LALRMEETRDKRRRIELDSAKQQQQNEWQQTEQENN